jgi:MarR family transcriptional regulator, organic hydroperoxide resistance regulator
VTTEPIVLTVQRAAHATLHALTRQLGPVDLTPSEINALGNLADGRPRTVTELGVAVGAKPATVTGILDRLERRGLVTRRARQGDRRSVHVELTPDGRRSARMIHAAIGEIERSALAGVTGDALAGAYAVLQALIDAQP